MSISIGEFVRYSYVDNHGDMIMGNGKVVLIRYPKGGGGPTYRIAMEEGYFWLGEGEIRRRSDPDKPTPPASWLEKILWTYRSDTGSLITALIVMVFLGAFVCAIH